jgi:putative ABC transport system permease protein
MFAFGLPPRSVLAVSTVESALLGVLGTLLGLAGGYATVWWMVNALFAESLPDIALEEHLDGTTVGVVLVLGVGVVAVAPVLTARRLRRMDVPSTLRLVE